MKNIEIEEYLKKFCSIVKKIFFIVCCIIGILTIIAGTILWQISRVNELSQDRELKEGILGTLILCKEKATEKPKQKSNYNYDYYVKNGECPAEKDIAQNIEEKRSKLCKEIKDGLIESAKISNRLDTIFFRDSKQNAEKRYEEEYVKKGYCQLIFEKN